jgi:hypothetical protein
MTESCGLWKAWLIPDSDVSGALTLIPHCIGYLSWGFWRASPSMLVRCCAPVGRDFAYFRDSFATQLAGYRARPRQNNSKAKFARLAMAHRNLQIDLKEHQLIPRLMYNVFELGGGGTSPEIADLGSVVGGERNALQLLNFKALF